MPAHRLCVPHVLLLAGLGVHRLGLLVREAEQPELMSAGIRRVRSAGFVWLNRSLILTALRGVTVRPPDAQGPARRQRRALPQDLQAYFLPLLDNGKGRGLPVIGFPGRSRTPRRADCPRSGGRELRCPRHLPHPAWHCHPVKRSASGKTSKIECRAQVYRALGCTSRQGPQQWHDSRCGSSRTQLRPVSRGT
jgi:hypothetical protein